MKILRDEMAVLLISVILFQESLMKILRDEMAAFFDVVNAKEFKHIEQKYPSPGIVLGKLAEKVDQIDK